MEKSYKDFSIERELGRGSFGIVYLVRQRVTKQPFVLKRINIGHINQKHQQTALREVEILKKISHPNIIKYYYSFIEDNMLSIITEYAEAGDLNQYLIKHRVKKLNFSETELWRILNELGEALKYLHANNIIHRDIKCQNVFLTKNLTVKLGDLGASKLMNAEMQATRVGTPLYLAPEMVKQQPYNFKIDVWGLGCIMYTLATKEFPFIGTNLITLGISIINRIPKNIPSCYSQRLNTLILSMLEKDPENRPDVREILNTIKGKEEALFKAQQRNKVPDEENLQKKFVRINRPRPMAPALIQNIPAKPVIKEHHKVLKMCQSNIDVSKNPSLYENKLKNVNQSCKETNFDSAKELKCVEIRPSTGMDFKSFQGFKRPLSAKPTVRTIIKCNTTANLNVYLSAPKVNKMKFTVNDLYNYQTSRG